MFRDQNDVDAWYGLGTDGLPRHRSNPGYKPAQPEDMTVNNITREQVSWLRTLITAFEGYHRTITSIVKDEDPSATSEMLRSVNALADNLDMHLDLQEKPQELPSEEQIANMAKAAGLDDIPF